MDNTLYQTCIFNNNYNFDQFKFIEEETKRIHNNISDHELFFWQKKSYMVVLRIDY